MRLGGNEMKGMAVFCRFRRAYQLLLPPPCFLVLDGDSPAYPALPKYLGRLSSGAAVPLARPAWSRSVVLWERVTEVQVSALPLVGDQGKRCPI